MRKTLSTSTGGKTVVWVYAPGIIADGRYDSANVEALTGVPQGTTELTTKAMDGWRSVFAPQPNLSAETLRRLAREARVHIYCDSDEPLHADGWFLALHTATGGQRTIRLPHQCAQMREVFSGRILGENVTAFTDQLAAPDTVLYELQRAPIGVGKAD